ncbi:bifunctional aldolase/short-chain dehydrogenase [Maritalea porphyrae]|uniref:bifunctional aldolase/short-chain dehydrogenase n=1 Tax=Maritalea porphyrae TaxID=880732 RepID=UPI0022B00AB3|nr:bifunctional aldolase/short-chain dehydrogenase [Maritalea porphyrae]MCZ4274166.1 bifunctional aldolase/short-chain dehydrogenase [Maritalea porphyrae]
MVKNLWNAKDAQQLHDNAGPEEADRQLALRVYTSRLIGQDPDMVMHGGGNTSVKVSRQNIFGDKTDVLHVKGSGWDLETIEAAGLPGVHIAPLEKLRQLDALSDEDMVNLQRSNLLDSTSPNPSVETLLHAYIPHKFVDHTHATAMLALANLPNVKEVLAEIFGDKVAFVPYIMPGFELAKVAADVFDKNPNVEGLLLINHGHFTFGPDAKSSYELMVDHVSAVENWFERRADTQPHAPKIQLSAKSVLPKIRASLARAMKAHTGNQDQAAPFLDLRTSDQILRFLAREDLDDLATRGVATPDHVIRTKAFPTIIASDDQGEIDAAIDKFINNYKEYFARQNARVPDQKTMLLPTPNLFWVHGLGIIGVGSNAGAARIAADLGVQTVQVMEWAEGSGGFYPINEDDLFDMEYWALEQAKLGKAKPKAMLGKAVLITGGAGAIGLAAAKAFRDQGANIFLVDRDRDGLFAALNELGMDHDGAIVDLCSEDGPQTAVDAIVSRFGGVDVLVSNAGAAWSKSMLEMDQDTLRNSFELNFFSHQKIAQAVARVMQVQSTGGSILFNVSKQAVNPGKDFGAYGLPKAATFFLVKQFALELGELGIRVNGVNADRIRSGLLTDEFIASRSKSRNISAETYLSGNLLKREVEASHVAQAFVALALAPRTTAHIMTVDGGNIEASLR